MTDIVKTYRQSHFAGGALRPAWLREVALIVATFAATFAFVSLVVGQLFFAAPGLSFAERSAAAREPINFAESSRGLSVLDEYVPDDAPASVNFTGIDSDVVDIALPTLFAMAAAFVLISLWFRNSNALSERIDANLHFGSADEKDLLSGDGSGTLHGEAAARLDPQSRHRVAAASGRDDEAHPRRRPSANALGAFNQQPEFA